MKPQFSWSPGKHYFEFTSIFDGASWVIDFEPDCIVAFVSDMWERLTIGHAWARSVKVQVFEERVEACITQTKHLPRTMALGQKWCVVHVEMHFNFFIFLPVLWHRITLPCKDIDLKLNHVWFVKQVIDQA